MREIIKSFLLAMVLGAVSLPGLAIAGSSPSSGISSPMVVPQIVEEAKKNNNWKYAYATGKHAQLVFMNISPDTNPKNEIGMETHPFDQIIIIASGKAKVLLNDQASTAKTGDLIFIPLGTAHNVINLSSDKPLKVISVYSDNDIPAGSVFKKKMDEAKD